MGQTQHVYMHDSPYSQPISWTSVLPARRLPCQGADSTTGALRQGLEMWQNLGTIACSAERVGGNEAIHAARI